MKFKITCPWCKYSYNGLDYIETGDMEGFFAVKCKNVDKSL